MFYSLIVILGISYINTVTKRAYNNIFAYLSISRNIVALSFYNSSIYKKIIAGI
jgi:hypothetical protein